MIATTLAGTLARSSRPARLAGLISGTIEAVPLWFARARGRRYLADLDDRLLRDIGITRADVEPVRMISEDDDSPWLGITLCFVVSALTFIVFSAISAIEFS